VAVAVAVVFVLSHLTVRIMAGLMNGITTSYPAGDALEVRPEAYGRVE
jgi:hypothetical protein